MPFKSEAQRRYLWANEPEIARDWADTYGSRIEKNEGGIMRLGLRSGGPGPGGQGARGQATQNPGVGGSSAPPGRDPRGAHRGMHYQAPIQHSPHINEGSKLHTTAPGTLSDPREKEDYFNQSWTGQPGIFGIGGGYKNLKTPGVTAGGHQSNFGIGNLFRGAMGMFGGWPGKIGSFASGMGDKMFQGRGDYKNQADWQAAKDARINQKRIANMLRRKGLGKEYGEQNLYDVSGGQYDFREDQFGENQAGITGVDGVQEEFDFGELIKKKDKTVADNIDWENEYDFTDKRLPPSHPDYWKKQDMDYGVRELRDDMNEWDEWQNQGWREKDTSEIKSHPDYWPKQNRNIGYLEGYKDPNDPFHRKRESDYGRYNEWIDKENPIKNYYPLKGNKQGLETIDINEDVLDINEVGPRITQIGGEGLSIPKEWLEAPISQIERTIQNLQTGVDNANALGMEGSEDNEKNKKKLEQLKKVIEFKKKKGETAEGLST